MAFVTEDDKTDQRFSMHWDFPEISLLGLGFGQKSGWEMGFGQNFGWEMGFIPPSGPSFRFIVYFFPLFCIHYSKLPYTKGKGNKNFIKDKIEPQQIYHHCLYVEAQMILMTSIILFCTFDKVTQSTWRGDLRKPSGIHKCMCTPSVF